MHFLIVINVVQAAAFLKTICANGTTEMHHKWHNGTRKNANLFKIFSFTSSICNSKYLSMKMSISSEWTIFFVSVYEHDGQNAMLSIYGQRVLYKHFVCVLCQLYKVMLEDSYFVYTCCLFVQQTVASPCHSYLTTHTTW